MKISGPIDAVEDPMRADLGERRKNRRSRPAHTPDAPTGPAAKGFDRRYSGRAETGDYSEHQATNAEAHECAVAEHDRLCQTVVEHITASGLEVGERLRGVPVDLAWRDRAGNQVIAEVKGFMDDGSLVPLRLGLGQILQYQTELANNGVFAEALLVVSGVVDSLWYDVCARVNVVLVNMSGAEGLAALDTFIDVPSGKHSAK